MPSIMTPELWTSVGAALAIFLSSLGSCYASVHAGLFALRYHAELRLKCFFPIIIAGVLAIYGLIVGGLLAFKLRESSVSLHNSQHFFGAGLAGMYMYYSLITHVSWQKKGKSNYFV